MTDALNKRLEEKAKTALIQQAQSLDSTTLHRLREAREIALSQPQQSSWSSSLGLPPLNIKWATGAGAGLALASVLTFMIAPNLMTSNKLSPLDDIELLTTNTDLDLVTQMEFYQWLDDSALSESTL